MNLLSIITIAFISKFQTNYNDSSIYLFDTKLMFKSTTIADTSKSAIITYYINSKDNSYYIKVRTFKKLESEFTFIDKNGKCLYSKLSETQRDSIENNGLYSENYLKYSSTSNKIAKKYNFYKLNDTIINNKKMGRYLFKYEKPKVEKKKKLWRSIYFIEQAENVAPFLEISIKYNTSKYSKNIPNGILNQIDHYNEKGILIYSDKLITTSFINFKLETKEPYPSFF